MRAGNVVAGGGAAAAWFLVFGLIGTDLRGYACWTLFAGVVAWLDRAGARPASATGVWRSASRSSRRVGWSVAAIAVAVGWAATGDWPLW